MTGFASDPLFNDDMVFFCSGLFVTVMIQFDPSWVYFDVRSISKSFLIKLGEQERCQ